METKRAHARDSLDLAIASLPKCSHTDRKTILTFFIVSFLSKATAAMEILANSLIVCSLIDMSTLGFSKLTS